MRFGGVARPSRGTRGSCTEQESAQLLEGECGPGAADHERLCRPRPISRPGRRRQQEKRSARSALTADMGRVWLAAERFVDRAGKQGRRGHRREPRVDRERHRLHCPAREAHRISGPGAQGVRHRRDRRALRRVSRAVGHPQAAPVASGRLGAAVDPAHGLAPAGPPGSAPAGRTPGRGLAAIRAEQLFHELATRYRDPAAIAVRVIEEVPTEQTG